MSAMASQITNLQPNDFLLNRLFRREIHYIEYY